MPLNQIDHGDVSWGDLSTNWPKTTAFAEAKYYICTTGFIPYGSYVLCTNPAGVKELRIEKPDLLDKLENRFNLIKACIDACDHVRR